MQLAGQDRDPGGPGWRRGAAERGYAMAVLLISLSVMAVMMSVAMPVWHQMAQREKEEELVFRGKQYARAIGLFQRKFAGAFPPNIEILLEQRFLRKKYKDPMSPEKNGEFQVLYQLTQQPAAAAQPGGAPGTARPGVATPQPATTPQIAAAPGSVGGPRGGVVGVASKSKEKSIRLYNGRNHYNEWAFVYTPATMQPGGAPGTQRPGQQPGAPGPPRGPAQPGRPPGGFGTSPFNPSSPMPRPPQ